MKSIALNMAITVINTQIKAIKNSQKADKQAGVVSTGKRTNEVMAMARALAAILAEQRKAGEEAEEQLTNLTPDRMCQLVLKLIARLAADHRQAVRAYIDELAGV